MRTALVQRWSTALKKIRPALVSAVKAGRTERAQCLLNRLNKVCKHQRETNLRNGMPGRPFENWTLEQVELQITFETGLI